MESEKQSVDYKKLFLRNKDNLTQINHFIEEEEKNNFDVSILAVRSEIFIGFITTLKKDLEFLAKKTGVEYLTALYHFYLGELYAKCQQTYSVSGKFLASHNLDNAEMRLKCAIIHYLNAMLDTQRDSLSRVKGSFLNYFQRSWWLKRSRGKVLRANKQKIFFRIVLTLTELLNAEPAIAAAIDGLYPQAHAVLRKYIQYGSEVMRARFLRPAYYKEIKRMLGKYNYTIFEKMGVDVSRVRVQARKSLGILTTDEVKTG